MSDDKIVSLRPLPHGITAGDPLNVSTVEILEKWLERAKRGEIEAVAIAVSKPNCQVTTDWSSGPADSIFRVVAAVTMLHTEMGQLLLDRARGG